ncbi:MAG TPA: efflux RND transporter periplasmic adaptor subunit, partial [Burkholderiales bacterium]|nr:efflux RND transporter periplasmic adaptor subunit [Burkholderiales bacterium]
RPRALAVRTEAVHDVSSAEPWVLVVHKGRAVRRPVRLGLRGEGWVEVLEGPAEGELIVAASDPRVRPGQRVRALPNA